MTKPTPLKGKEIDANCWKIGIRRVFILNDVVSAVEGLKQDVKKQYKLDQFDSQAYDVIISMIDKWLGVEK